MQPRHYGLRTALYGVLGLVFGFAVLHPVSMIIFRWLDPRLSGSMTTHSESMLAPFFHAFRPDMAPMGFVFGLFSAAIAVIDGTYRVRLARERDSLAAQLVVNRRYRSEVLQQASLLRRQNERLSAMEEANRPGTRVVLDAEATPQGDVVFSCTDDGQGLPPEVEERLFLDFARGDRSLDHESTGLGLAFCKAAVEAHGGRIWYESPGDRGARFLFTIPSTRKEPTGV